MHYDKTLFRDYHRLRHRLYVSGIGRGVYAIGIGTIPIMDGKGNVRDLQRVLHIPQLKHGLLSLTQLALLGWTTFDCERRMYSFSRQLQYSQSYPQRFMYMGPELS